MYGNNSVGDLGVIATGCASHLAAQPELGLLSERRARNRPAHRFDFGAGRPHLAIRAAQVGEFMHELHQQAAEQHEMAARAHRTAAEHNEKGDNQTGNWHSERAIEYADRAYELAKKAHNKSGQMEKF
jgi:hypothetical protein